MTDPTTERSDGRNLAQARGNEHAPRVLDWFRHLRQQRLSLLQGGARALLDRAEWQGEQILHIGRGILLFGLLAILILVWRVSLGGLVAGVLSVLASALLGSPVTLQIERGGVADWVILFVICSATGGLWYGYWWIVRNREWWRWLRYPFIVFDAVIVLRLAILARSEELAGQVLGVSGAGIGLSPQDVAGVMPAAFLVIIFSGVLRMHPFTAAAAGLAGVLGYLASARLLGVPARQLVPELTLLGLMWFLGMQFVFVLRGIALKAAQEDVLERFVPQGLTQRIAQAGGTVPARVVPVTIIVPDIRGFTTASEPLGPQQAVALLNDFFATIVAPLAAEEAVLDKYLGDGLLAFVEGEDHAARALRAAHGIVQAVAALNARRANPAPGDDHAAPADQRDALGQSPQPVQIGIAVHTAEAFVGSIGAPARMEYTIVGDAVNVAFRLEGLTSTKAGDERLDAVLVASADTVSAAAAGGVTLPGLLGPLQVAVHGRAHPLDVYYLPNV